MNKSLIHLSYVIPFLMILHCPSAIADDHTALRADLAGIKQVPVAITPGQAQFEATFTKGMTEIPYSLNYSVAGGPVLFADIHLGQHFTTGGINFYLCANQNAPAPNPPFPVGTPPCPGPDTGTVTGVITADGIVGPTGQGIAAKDFEKAVQAILDGNTYAQIHTTKYPTGELRGQITTNHKSNHNYDD